MRQLSYTIEPEADGLSVNAYARNIAGLSRAFLRSVKFRENGILINGQRVTTRGVLHAGDSLVFNIPNDRTQKVVPAEGPVSIVFENEDIVLVNKPAGLVIHPCHGHYSDTLLSYLAWYYRLLPEQPLLCPIGRLDKDTSGLLVVAKNDAAHQSLAAQIAAHTAYRGYEAIVVGSVKDDTGTVDKPIARHKTDRKKMAIVEGGREAITHYTVIKRYNGYTYMAFQLETGRTHQIRVHMASIGHPIIGDPVYGLKKDRFSNIGGQCLHAAKLTLTHPKTGERMEFSASLPQYFTEVLDKLERMQ